MRNLNHKELKKVNGGFAPLTSPAAQVGINAQQLRQEWEALLRLLSGEK